MTEVKALIAIAKYIRESFCVDLFMFITFLGYTQLRNFQKLEFLFEFTLKSQYYKGPGMLHENNQTTNSVVLWN